MRRLIKIIDLLANTVMVIAGVILVALMLHVTLDVVTRALFRTAPTGTIVFVSEYYMALIVCLPLAWVERADAHVSVDVFTGLLPGGVQRHLIAWTLPVSAAIFALVAYAAWKEGVTQYRLHKFVIEGGIRFTTWYGYFALPVGYGLGALYMMLKFLKYLVGFETGGGAAESADEAIEQVMYD